MISGLGNTSGGFNPQQMINKMQAHKEQMVQEFDVDGNGELSKTEFAEGISQSGGPSGRVDQIFNKIDTDGNGTISTSEMESKQNQMKEKFGGGSNGFSAETGSFDLTALLLQAFSSKNESGSDANPKDNNKSLFDQFSSQ